MYLLSNVLINWSLFVVPGPVPVFVPGFVFVFVFGFGFVVVVVVLLEDGEKDDDENKFAFAFDTNEELVLIGECEASDVGEELDRGRRDDPNGVGGVNGGCDGLLAKLDTARGNGLGSFGFCCCGCCCGGCCCSSFGSSASGVGGAKKQLFFIFFPFCS